MPERLNHQKELCLSFPSHHRVKLVITQGAPGQATEDSLGWDDNLRRASLCVPQSAKYLSTPGTMIIIKLYYRHG